MALLGLFTVGVAVANDAADNCKSPYSYYNYGQHGYPEYGSWYGHQTGPDADYQARYGYGYDQGYYSGAYHNSYYYGYLISYHNHSYKYHAADPAGPTGPWMYCSQGHYHRK